MQHSILGDRSSTRTIPFHPAVALECGESETEIDRHDCVQDVLPAAIGEYTGIEYLINRWKNLMIDLESECDEPCVYMLQMSVYLYEIQQR